MYSADILAKLSRVADTDSCAMIMRHAARYPIVDIHHSLEVGLTDRGMNDAYRLGSTLNSFPNVRLFYSPALRCKQTAECIMRGLEGNGVSVSITGPELNLCAPYIKDESCLTAAAQAGKEFIRKWFDGKISSDWILDTASAAHMVITPVIKRLMEPSAERRLDIHISHDWEVSLLREELLNLRYEDVGWPPYLDSVLFQADSTDVRVIYGSHEAPLKLTIK
ncbi:MAG: histidine phosphatase family protein [Euryarchaeota archaeon]|nr:histidine phosphatase family protein [Euryarchaeota archaeon]